MDENDTLEKTSRTLSERTTMIRGRGAYGVKPHRGTLSRIAEYVPVTVHHYDESTGETTIENVQNVNAIANDNREQRLSGDDGYTPSRDFKKVASIPNVVVEQLKKQGINIFDKGDWPKIASLLDSSDWEIWRTAPGVISKRAYREHFVPPSRKN